MDDSNNNLKVGPAENATAYAAHALKGRRPPRDSP
jgi:hypothetical protein